MSDIRPFRGIRPRPDVCAEIAAPPYDVVDFDEARVYVDDRPNSFLRVEKSEIDLDRSLDPLDEKIFAKGAQNLKRLLDAGLMLQDRTPCFYLYRQRMGEHVQTGVVVGASVAEYQNGLIKKHEHTRADKEEERTRHVDQVGANTGPVFLTYHARAEIDRFVVQACQRAPEVDFVAEDDIGHALWVISQPADVQQLVELFARVPALYVADGHHRSAAASRVQQMRMQKMRQERGAAASDDALCNHFLTVIFPHDQMKIMEYNRVVLDLNGLSPQAFLEAVQQSFVLAPTSQGKPNRPRTFGMYLEGAWYQLAAREGTFDAKDPVAGLDVAILQSNLLAPVLGIENPRTDKRIQFVGGIRGTQALATRVDRRAAEKQGPAVAFAMYPTAIEQLMAIADAGQVMPPKSTWFEPKLRSGMVVRSINE